MAGGKAGGSGDAKRIGRGDAIPGRSGNGANFNHTGANTAPRPSLSKGKSGLKSQKKASDYDKFGKGISKTTSTDSGSAGGRRGGGAPRTFMNG